MQPASKISAGIGRRLVANSAEGRKISAETNIRRARFGRAKHQVRASLADEVEIEVK
jgi:hypothetical protein